jgi:hypothetical protein
MWDVVKSLALRKKTNSITRRHATKGNGTKGKIPQKEKTQTLSRLGVQTQRQFH